MASSIQEDAINAPQHPSTLSGTANILSKFSLAGKVVVVTGGARGLGYEMLRGFCQAGATGVAIIDVLQEFADAAIDKLTKEFGVTAIFQKVDVRDHVAVEEAIDVIARKFGRIDVLLCSAGVADNIKAEEYPVDRFKRVMDINLNGVFFCAQSVGKRMIEQKTGGSIIAIASMSGHIVNHPQPQCAYNASKAAVIQLCKSLAAEWAPHKIRVNTISPGYMNTILNEKFDPLQKKIWFERTPQDRMGNVDELNGAALYLASDASSYATGTDILVDGGYTTW